MLLVKEKTKGTNPTVSSGWESLLFEDFFVQSAGTKTAEQLLEGFRVRANAKLVERLGAVEGGGSGIPPIPSDLLQRVLWLIRFGMQFRPDTGQIVFK
jgi:hypothetical protein